MLDSADQIGQERTTNDGPIVPRATDFAQWYQDIIAAAELVDQAPVRGCYILRPNGYFIWESIQRDLDARFKQHGVQNAYFPLLIPMSFVMKEAEHVEGFAPELAVVTVAGGKKLEEPYVIRPTSETIVGHFFAKWIQSHRDLPMLINQWANVLRWELRTRMFLRTTEFLWQEGHTAHATSQEAVDETMQMLRVYADFAENWMAMPVIQGIKTESERFPGAVDTYCIEAMMQDGKALQAGTSHFLGQNFAKASEIMFLDADGQQKHAWTTSWGVSTRLIGAMVMTHSDDDGLIVPPRLAPTHVVILPVLHKPETAQQVLDYCKQLAADLRAQSFAGRPIEVEIDARDLRGGDKLWQWVKKGVPVRVEVGPRDIEQGAVFVARRDRSTKDKAAMPRDAFVAGAAAMLQEIQDGLFARAKAFRDAHTKRIDTKAEFEAFFTPRKQADENAPPEIHGGFALAHFCGDPAVEAEVKDRLGVTIRCIPLDAPEEQGACVITGRPSSRRVVWAKSY